LPLVWLIGYLIHIAHSENEHTTLNTSYEGRMLKKRPMNWA